MKQGKGTMEIDDTHKLKLKVDELKNSQSEVPKIKNPILYNLSSRKRSVQRPTVTVPSSIRVGSDCSGRTCTTVNVYALETYVKNGLDDEWIPSWHANSLKAGAIAYRSYGVYYIYNPISTNYDICNTVSCQVHDSTDSTAATDSATAQTSGKIVTDCTRKKPFKAEYAAENNKNSCADGFIGSPNQDPVKNWPCMSDAVDAGKPFHGHGRGMCQWGTQRWAIQGKDYVWIVNHYYNNNGNPSGARSGLFQP